MIFNKKFKLKCDFNKRVPLIIRRKNNVIYFQTQLDVAKEDGYRYATYPEVKYKTDEYNTREIGMTAHKLLKELEETGDLSIAEYEQLVKVNIERNASVPENTNPFLKFHDAKDFKDLSKNYDECSLHYDIYRKKYSFHIWWSMRNGYPGNSDSLGTPKILTFDTPLEFTDHSAPEKLGEIIIEALDRSRKIGEKVAGNYRPPKIIELPDDSELIVEAPRDKHFVDEEDYGVCEIYQMYGYYPREDSDEASATFYIGMAAELNGETDEENIRSAWEKQNGKAEFFEVKPAEYGIFKLRAEMKNKSVHRISYLSEIADGDLIDCTMELRKPNTRKKLDEKLTCLFEEFALRCKFKT